ncbi:hypothetical protein [Lonepinella sp. BR2474]|uniref:hypothetical protein n=1 Tax=Lonepinella sp. BR2474 TaxID=3434548 RepID=UPI003F6DED49
MNDVTAETEQNKQEKKMDRKGYILFFLVYYPFSILAFLLSSATGIRLPLVIGICLAVRWHYVRMRCVDIGWRGECTALLITFLMILPIIDIFFHILLMVIKSKDLNEE